MKSQDLDSLFPWLVQFEGYVSLKQELVGFFFPLKIEGSSQQVAVSGDRE